VNENSEFDVTALLLKSQGLVTAGPSTLNCILAVAPTAVRIDRITQIDRAAR
jgi:hypothetical protein